MPPSHARETLRRWREEAQLWTKDLADLVGGRRAPLVPPRRLMFDGPRDPKLFAESGREFLRHYVELCALEPDERVLDVGSGIGRKTVPLTGYLATEGRYAGLDVNPRGVDWCRSRITPGYPNFEFRRIDVFNRRYNPRGTVDDSEYRFPFADESFDFVVMASVFTHMFPGGVARYLRETARVLAASSGRCLITFFLLNSEAEELTAAGRGDFRFPHRRERHAIEREHRPEDAVAYDEDFVRELYRAAGLTVTALHRGGWCGRPDATSYQDLIVAERADRAGS